MQVSPSPAVHVCAGWCREQPPNAPTCPLCARHRHGPGATLHVVGLCPRTAHDSPPGRNHSICQRRFYAPSWPSERRSCRDVTDLHRMEAERQVISEIVHALNQTANLDELLQGIHQALKKVLYAENCFVALHDREADAFTFPFFVDQVDVAPVPQKVGRSCTAFVFRRGSPMLISQSEFDRLAAEGEVELVGSPSPSWLGVPLKTPTATIGVLVVQHYQNENAYDIRDLEFLSSVGGHIALAIERRRSEEELRKNEEMFRLLFSYNPLPTWVMDRETLRFLEVNDAAVRQYGYSLNEFKKMSVLD